GRGEGTTGVVGHRHVEQGVAAVVGQGVGVGHGQRPRSRRRVGRRGQGDVGASRRAASTRGARAHRDRGLGGVGGHGQARLGVGGGGGGRGGVGPFAGQGGRAGEGPRLAGIEHTVVVGVAADQVHWRAGGVGHAHTEQGVGAVVDQGVGGGDGQRRGARGGAGRGGQGHVGAGDGRRRGSTGPGDRDGGRGRV